MRSFRSLAFTLLELLSVMAIIGLLAALLFPGLRAARLATNKARTKVLFSQWASAVESFRGEYGHYPAFDATLLVNGGATADPGGDHPFHDVLAGRRRDGSVLPAGSTAAEQNRRRISFYAFGEADFTHAASPLRHLLCDAFDGTEIAVLVDRDLDGMIRPGSDYLALPPLGGVTPTAVDIPAMGVRVGVIFYTIIPGTTTLPPEFIFSWK
jgi:prepilin-type N-terminal cleavage/methylation domain-containing protein